MQEWLELLAMHFGYFGVYFGVFLVGLISAASVIIPLPGTVVLLGVAALREFDPVLLALAFGLGAAVGQLTSYAVGYAGRFVVSEKYDRRLNAMLAVFERYGMLAVFIFALTPLPDSLLFIPMGLVHYPLWKVFVAAVAGKIAMSLIITHVGGAIGEAFIGNWVVAGITTALLILMVIAMLKVKWEELLVRYLPKGQRK